MKATTLVLALAALLAATPFVTCRAFADGGDEPPDGTEVKSAPLYPSSIEAEAGDRMNRLTNDGLDKLEAFYRKTLGPNDGIEPLPADGMERGFTVKYRVSFRNGSTEEQAVLMITKPDTLAMKAAMVKYGGQYPQPLPLTNLQNLVGRFNHTQAEYDKACAAYQWLKYVSYWYPPDATGEVLMRYQEKVFGPMPKTAPKAKAGDKEKLKGMEGQAQQVKAMRDAGDLAGMMALAQQMQEEVGQTGVGQQSQQIASKQLEGMMKDSWNDWLACLKELAATAYWVKLSYTGSTTWYRQTELWVETP